MSRGTSGRPGFHSYSRRWAAAAALRASTHGRASGTLENSWTAHSRWSGSEESSCEISPGPAALLGLVLCFLGRRPRSHGPFAEQPRRANLPRSRSQNDSLRTVRFHPSLRSRCQSFKQLPQHSPRQTPCTHCEGAWRGECRRLTRPASVPNSSLTSSPASLPASSPVSLAAAPAA